MSLEFVMYEISAINRQIILAVFLQKTRETPFIPTKSHKCMSMS